MSTVYQARPVAAADHLSQSKPSAQYAVKVLRERWQADSLAVGFFRREAMIGRTVRHPYLVSILASQLVEPPYFVVMPCLSGVSVARWLRHEPLPLPTALWVARQAAEALMSLHHAGFLHCDVKPANLLMARDGHVTLIDLSLSREKQETGSVFDRPLIGTIGYLPPELLTSTFATDERSDLYSLGATLFEMLSGRTPYAAHSLEELVECQQREPIPHLRSLVPQTPVAVSELVHQLLARNPARRPGTCQEVIRRLIRFEIECLGQANCDCP